MYPSHLYGLSIAIAFSSLAIGPVVIKYSQIVSQPKIQKYIGATNLLVIAHPDDESMFFGPTVLNILDLNKTLVILCMTTGDADGLGHIRVDEMSNVARRFGDMVSLSIINDTRIPDNMNADWNHSLIADYIELELSKKQNSIGTLITFDDYGISSHLNHRSLHKSVLEVKKRKTTTNLNYYQLESVSLWRKYLGLLDSVPTLLTSLFDDGTIRLALDSGKRDELRKNLEMHASQMVWFRKLYMYFSRYMIYNELRPL